MKFKEGDILEFEGRGTYLAKKGAKAIYQGHYIGWEGEEYIKVKWIRDELSGNQDDGGYYESQFTKVEEVSTQKEDRIFEENKKVMKIDFKESKEQVVDLLEQFMMNFESDMLHDIRIIASRDGENTLEQIEEIIESIRFHKQNAEEAIIRLENANTLQEVLEAMENTVFEGDEATVLKAFFGVDSVTID